jgi:hypothetical protein
VGTVTREKGGYKLEAPWPRGSVDQGTHLQLSGLGWSGIKYGSSGSGTGAGPNLYLMLNTRTRELMAETRDLRMAICSHHLSSIQSSVIDPAISCSIQSPISRAHLPT